jgi:hypothetical protein
MKPESLNLELVGAQTLLERLWPDEKERPSLRTLRNWQKRRIVPYIRLGRLVYFHPQEVADAIRSRWTVRSR